MAKKPHKIHIDHHHDHSHTSHRHHKNDDGTTTVKSAAHPDLDGVHDMLQDHLGSPNPGEPEADAGQHGIPAAVAGPAAIGGGAPAATSQMAGAGV